MTEDDRRDYEKLLQLRELVKDEEEEFQQFAKDIYRKQVASRPQMLKAEVKRYIDEYYEHRLQRLKDSPRLYEQVGNVEAHLGESSTY